MPGNKPEETRLEGRSLLRIPKWLDASQDQWVKAVLAAAVEVGMLEALLSSKFITFRGKKEAIAKVPYNAVAEGRVYRIKDLEDPTAVAITLQQFTMNTALRSKARSQLRGSPLVPPLSATPGRGLGRPPPPLPEEDDGEMDRLRDLRGEVRGYRRRVAELQTALEDIGSNIQTLEAELRSSEAAAQVSQETSDDARITSGLRERVAQQNEELESLQEAEVDLQREISLVTGILREAEEREERLSERMTELRNATPRPPGLPARLENMPLPSAGGTPPFSSFLRTPSTPLTMDDILDDYVFVKTKEVESSLLSHVKRHNIGGGFIDEYGDVEDPSGERYSKRAALWNKMHRSLEGSPWAYLTQGDSGGAVTGTVIHMYDIAALYRAMLSLTTLTSQSHVARLKQEVVAFVIKKDEHFLKFMNRAIKLIDRCREAGLKPDYSLLNRSMYQGVLTIKDMGRQGEEYEQEYNDLPIGTFNYDVRHEALFNKHMRLLTGRAQNILQRDSGPRNKQLTMAFSATSTDTRLENRIKELENLLNKKQATAKAARKKEAQAAKADGGPRKDRSGKEMPPTAGQCRYWWLNETCEYGTECRYEHKGPRKNQNKEPKDGKNHCGVTGHKDHSKEDCWKLHPEKMPAHIKKKIAKKANANMATAAISAEAPEEKYDIPTAPPARANAARALTSEWNDGADTPDNSSDASDSEEPRRASAHLARVRIRPRSFLSTLMLLFMMITVISAQRNKTGRRGPGAFKNAARGLGVTLGMVPKIQFLSRNKTLDRVRPWGGLL